MKSDDGLKFKGVGISYRPEFDEFWPEITKLIDCVEFIPDELSNNATLIELTKRATAQLPTMAHITGLSIASPDLLPSGEFEKIRESIISVGADVCSDHLAFRRSGSTEIDNFCLPLKDRISIDVIVENHAIYQELIGRKLLLENITINGLLDSAFDLNYELELIKAVTDANIKILFDVNNCFINCVNFSMPVAAYLNKFPLESIAGIHVAGYENGDNWLIDSHMTPISKEIEMLAEEVLKASNAAFIVLERDNNSATRDEVIFEIEKLRRVWDRSKS
jgi:uncharacterized protein (UPF0276 family)